MKKRTAKVGDFVKWIGRIPDNSGRYGVVCKADPEDDAFYKYTILWLGNGEGLVEFNSSGFSEECKKISKMPKKYLKRIEKALLFALNSSPATITNLDFVETLAKIKKFI